LNESWINNNRKPLIFLGSCLNLEKFTTVCDEHQIDIHGIIDSDYYGNTEEFCGIPVIDTEDNIEKYKDDYNFFCATNYVPLKDTISVRNAEKRLSMLKLIEDHDLNCISLVHSKAEISQSASIGKGSFVDLFAVMDPDTSLGNHSHIYTFTLIGHGVKIGNNCYVQRMCMLGPQQTIEDNCFFATKSTVSKRYVTIQEGTFVQEGMYVMRGTKKGEVITPKSSPRVYSIIR